MKYVIITKSPDDIGSEVIEASNLVLAVNGYRGAGLEVIGIFQKNVLEMAVAGFFEGLGLEVPGGIRSEVS
jgi:hypothetical protein